jgi:hypothetical protein
MVHIVQNLGSLKHVINIIIRIREMGCYNVVYKVILQNVDAFTTWHERLGHPGVGMMRKIIGNSSGHNLNLAKFAKSLNFMCATCTIEKLILRPSPIKIKVEPLKFLERI